MSKNVVLFFDKSHLYITDAKYETNCIRGYCIDGCWSLDYNITAGVVNVCIGSLGVIHWESPINSYNAKLVTQVDIPIDISTLQYLQIIEWAKNERRKEVA